MNGKLDGQVENTSIMWYICMNLLQKLWGTVDIITILMIGIA